jgi:hypothetical protein
MGLDVSCVVVTTIWTTLKRLGAAGLFSLLASLVFAVVPTIAVYFLSHERHGSLLYAVASRYR